MANFFSTDKVFVFYRTYFRLLDSPPTIDKIVDDDLKQKAPEELNALNDMENADRYFFEENI